MDEGPVVADTSPLITLAGVGLLHLLPAIYDSVWIPDAVFGEYQTKMLSTDPFLETFSWLEMKQVRIDIMLASLPNLGLGEAAAISLAIDHNARAVLMDDKLARNVASARQLPVVGTMAVLLRAKRQGLIPYIRPIVDEMIAQGRRISGSLRQQILRAAGEEIEKA